jgi:hypothetical protein
MSMIDSINGKHHVKCDLCYSDITLTITAHPRSFIDHRGHTLCLQSRRNQGLPDPDPRTLPSASNSASITAIPVPPPSGLARIPCPGLAILWTPGSIWETYPYHQHEIRAVGWMPVSFGEEDNEIFLRSDKCYGMILDTDEPPCKECWLIEYSANFREVMERAKEVKEHTPWDLLTVQQTRALLQKMSAMIASLRTKVNKFIMPV